MPITVLAIDPGTDKSGWCLLDGDKVLDSGVSDNARLLNDVGHETRAKHLAIEMISSYGMPVGREVFETCVWIGRFQQAWMMPEDASLIYRRDVKMYLCGSAKAKDANIRQALLDRFPRTGGGRLRKSEPKKNQGHCSAFRATHGRRWRLR